MQETCGLIKWFGDRLRVIWAFGIGPATDASSPEFASGPRNFLRIQRRALTTKLVIKTNTLIIAAQAALKYKEPWQAKQLFLNLLSLLRTRPIGHQRHESL